MTTLRRATSKDIETIMEIERQPGFEHLVGRSARSIHDELIADPGHAYLLGLDDEGAGEEVGCPPPGRNCGPLPLKGNVGRAILWLQHRFSRFRRSGNRMKGRPFGRPFSFGGGIGNCVGRPIG